MHEAGRPSLHQNITDGGRFNRTSQHPSTGAVGRQLAQQCVLAAAPDNVDGVDLLTAKPLGIIDRGRVRLGETLQDAAREHRR